MKTRIFIITSFIVGAAIGWAVSLFTLPKLIETLHGPLGPDQYNTVWARWFAVIMITSCLLSGTLGALGAKKISRSNRLQ